MADEGKRWEEVVAAKIEDARQQGYRFWRRDRDEALARFKATRDIELLVDGVWVGVSRPYKFHRWKRLSDRELRVHARDYVVEDFGSARAADLGFWGQVRRCGVVRWLFPPLDGGAERIMDNAVLGRVRKRRASELAGATGNELAELKEEALRGHQILADRCAMLEQRANFFLGAAGLTSSLVLANAGLLIGTGKLDEPWLWLAAVFLGFASFCAVVAGLRAMQAAMSTFLRTTPNGVNQITQRGTMSGHSLTRAFVGSLLVAQNREEVVGNWKLARLVGARRWFLAAIVGVSLLTAVVLTDVSGRTTSESKGAPADLTKAQP